jgi:hypothetical protein
MNPNNNHTTQDYSDLPMNQTEIVLYLYKFMVMATKAFNML